MIGIGVGIDYALFIVTRYRQGLAEGATRATRSSRSLDTSGRAVLFAGCTVVISLLGMFLLGVLVRLRPRPRRHRGRAAGDGRVADAAAGPARLRRPGDRPAAHPRVPHSRPPSSHEHGFWYRWSRVIQRRPWTVGGRRPRHPAWCWRCRCSRCTCCSPTPGNDPTTLTTRRAYDLLAEGFGPGANGPLVVAVDLPAGADRPSLDDAGRRHLRQTPGVAFVGAAPAQPGRRRRRHRSSIPTTSPQSTETEHAGAPRCATTSIPPARRRHAGAGAYVGGVTAAGIDAADRFSQRLLLGHRRRGACCRSCC